jgi:hypothetical protein
MLKYTYILLFFCVLVGCKKDTSVPAEVEGLRPIYKKDLPINLPTVSGPRPLRNIGKIYERGSQIFIVEKGEGVHVFNRFSPTGPYRFYAIDWCQDVAVDYRSRLYATQISGAAADISVIDIWNMDNIQLVLRRAIHNVENVENKPPLPKDYSGYFECPDPTQGPVAGWEKTMLKNPRCKTKAPEFFETRNNSVGQAGSLSSVVEVNGFLYTIGGNHLQTFGITPFQEKLTLIDSVASSSVFETIFNYNDLLFVGTRSNMLIYKIQRDGKPGFFRSFQHETDCDPFVANDQLAFTSINASTTCSSNSTNELFITKTQEGYQFIPPDKLASHPMTSPLGLGLRDDILYLCEGAAGLKVIEYQRNGQIKVLHHYKDVHALSVTVLSERLCVVTPTALLLYAYKTNQGLELVSKIPIEP